jgi:hypothetical protein
MALLGRSTMTTSPRNQPGKKEAAMNIIVIVVLGGALLMILGGLVGLSLGQQLADGEVRRSARLRRESGDLWRQMQADCAQRAAQRCPQCGAPCSLQRVKRGTAAA